MFVQVANSLMLIARDLLRGCHQVCSKCNETKAPSEFYVSKYLSTGLHSQCKKCVRAGQERRVRCPPEKAAPEKVCRCGNPKAQPYP